MRIEGLDVKSSLSKETCCIYIFYQMNFTLCVIFLDYNKTYQISKFVSRVFLEHNSVDFLQYFT